MNVANKDLCAELYEVSGWESDHALIVVNKGMPSEYLQIQELGADEELDDVGADTFAYDLGYLLRKLPAAITPAVDNKKVAIKDMSTYFLFVQRTPDGYVASYNVIGNTLKFLYFKSADTPEDALCKLSIELFKQGVLKRED